MAFAAVYDETCADWDLMKAEAGWVFGSPEQGECPALNGPP
jgi:hypothetical protein